MFNNKSILITGGTGSFGQRFAQKILQKFNLKRLVIYSRDEFKQYKMQKNFNSKKIRFFIGDVRDSERLDFAMKKIDYVIHAAALKHVVSSEYNPEECIKTNILGAQNVINSALKNNVEKVIALSTDKAVSPANLYGATKLVSDKLFISANNIVGKQKTRFSVVRYGNVIGSRGSVLPHFLELKEKGKKNLPITDFNMTRFFITLDEGVNFSIKCFKIMIGGEILIPKCASIKILDLAKIINPKAKIQVIGLRPGEKIHEILFSRDDSKYAVEFKNHYLIKPSINLNIVNSYLKNSLNEKGKIVRKQFEYSSNSKNFFLKKSIVQKFIKSFND